MEEFIEQTVNNFPTCRVFSVRETKEVVLSHGHGYYVMKSDRFGHHYWAADWNGHGYL